MTHVTISQDQLTQLNDNRNYYFSRIPESPRCSITDPVDDEDRNSLIASSEKRGKSRLKDPVDAQDKLSDLSSIDETEEPQNGTETE